MRGYHFRHWFGRHRSAWADWTRRVLPTAALTPMRIAIVYTLFGFTALLVSDVVVVRTLSEPMRSQIQALKGGAEVLLTAGLIFALTKRLETQLRRKQRHLEQQRQELDVIHRLLRHNLRNDLCVIRGYTDQVRDALDATPTREKCAVILATVERMVTYTEHASRINKLAHTGGSHRTCDLVEEVPALLDRHPHLTGTVEVSTTLPEQALVEVHPMFEEALSEVLSNAIQHNDAVTPRIDVTVESPSPDSDLVAIHVADNGPGIPHTELEPLQAGKEEQLLHLSGIGLWFVKWTVERSGGDIAFDASEGGGTTVTIRVPNARGNPGGIASDQ